MCWEDISVKIVALLTMATACTSPGKEPEKPWRFLLTHSLCGKSYIHVCVFGCLNSFLCQVLGLLPNFFFYPVNFAYFRMLQFVIAIGSIEDRPECLRPSSRREGVVLDYSLDNGVTWHVLKVVEPMYYNKTVQVVSIDLPTAAKTDKTIFRWWQPLGFGGKPRYVMNVLCS